MLDRAVSAIVALGIPGFILLIAMEISGFVGAAAITVALSTLGGPFGMLGGIASLLLLALIGKALTRYGFARVVRLVIEGLVAKGHSVSSIRQRIVLIPGWVISTELRSKANQTLDLFESGTSVS